MADAMAAEIERRGLTLRLERVICMGKCDEGPTVKVAPGGAFYLGYGAENARDLIDKIAREHGLGTKTVSPPDMPPRSDR